jgi:shikimate kinase
MIMANGRVVLITGPKHSGKTAAAAELAGVTGGRLYDSDDVMRALNNKTPREIFKEGRDVFYLKEENALRHIINDFYDWRHEHGHRAETICIISTGGGLCDNQGALSYLRTVPDTRIVYLHVSVETAWERILKTSDAEGELPAFLRTDNPRETHRELHEARSEKYKSICDIMLDADNLTVREVVNKIVRGII